MNTSIKLVEVMAVKLSSIRRRPVHTIEAYPKPVRLKLWSVFIAFYASTLVTLSATAEATPTENTKIPTLVVMDTALDTSIPVIKSKLIHEVCILEWPSCPNGTKFMEGPGSSVLPNTILKNNGFDHGTRMVSTAIAHNPNLKVLFIRIIGHTSSGLRQRASPITLFDALQWVYSNKDKYNVVAIAISQGSHEALYTTVSNYCPLTSIDMLIDKLYADNIPTFFPTGNERDKSKINWPACIPNAVAVGGFENVGLDTPRPSKTSNYDKRLIDIWAEISWPVLNPGGETKKDPGTSIANQIAAARYVAVKVARPSLTAAQTVSLIKSKATPLSSDLPPSIRTSFPHLNQDILIFTLQTVLDLGRES